MNSIDLPNYFDRLGKPLIDQTYTLQRFQGKGGWTYAEIPEVAKHKNAPFGWVKVRGSIDAHEFSNYRLMPMGNGKLFLPVNAEIRKKIGKKEGDSVRIILFEDKLPLAIPQELIDCLQMEPGAYEKFLALKEGQQKGYIQWIYGAKKEETKVERMAKTIDRVMKGLNFYNQ